MQQAVKLNEATENYNTLAMNLQYLGNAYVTLVKNEEEPTAQTSTVDSNVAGSDPIPSGRTARLKKAVSFLEKGIGISRESGIADGLQNCYGDLSLAYRLLGDYKRSLDYADSFQLMRDSTYSSDNRVKMAKLATKGEQDLKEKQIALNKLEIQKKKNERIYFGIGVGMLLTIVSGLFFSRKTIQKEKNVSENLLLNILPAEVARELKQKGASDAKLFDDVTVLFTDFVGFSRVSEQLTPQQLVDELHTCFTAFDGIMGCHNVEKIKTVGDAYLAVSGLPLARTDHAESVLRAAIEIRDFMLARQQLLGDRTFQIRIGIHSGSVVAGIVGVKKFAYDVWGDTVNTAARMEQNSLPGKINVSSATYELLYSKFNFEYRGEVEAKNKGMLKMYFLN
jgi:adenylate cyclase